MVFMALGATLLLAGLVGYLIRQVFHDPRAVRAATLEITHSAEHDFLTGLPNRTRLNDRISQAIAVAHRHKTKLAVLFLDLDAFEHINVSLGHPIGDKLLQSVAKTPRDVLTPLGYGKPAGRRIRRAALRSATTGRRCYRREKNAAGGGTGSFHRPARSSHHGKHWRQRLSRGWRGCGDAPQERGHRDVRGQGKWLPVLSVFQACRQRPSGPAASHRGGSAACLGTAPIRAALPAEDQSENRGDYRGGGIAALDASDWKIDLSIRIYPHRGRLRPHSADRRMGPS